jgi:hypothetical protein
VLAIADDLTKDGLVLRYRVEGTDTGFEGEAGTRCQAEPAGERKGNDPGHRCHDPQGRVQLVELPGGKAYQGRVEARIPASRYPNILETPQRRRRL